MTYYRTIELGSSYPSMLGAMAGAWSLLNMDQARELFIQLGAPESLALWLIVAAPIWIVLAAIQSLVILADKEG